jgi:hypothetical protein
MGMSTCPISWRGQGNPFICRYRPDSTGCLGSGLSRQSVDGSHSDQIRFCWKGLLPDAAGNGQACSSVAYQAILQTMLPDPVLRQGRLPWHISRDYGKLAAYLAGEVQG